MFEHFFLLQAQHSLLQSKDIETPTETDGTDPQ